MRRFSLLIFLIAIAFQASAEEQERPKWIEASVVKEITVKKALAEGLPAGRLFVDGEAFKQWWEQAGQDAEDLPEVDFEKLFLSVEVKDAADPNKVHWSGKLSEEGEIDVMGMSTLIGYEPSDRVTLTLLAFEREHVKSLVRWEYILNEHRKRERIKRVYPLEGQEDEDQAE